MEDGVMKTKEMSMDWNFDEILGLMYIKQESKRCHYSIVSITKDKLFWRNIMSFAQADEFINKIQEAELVQPLVFNNEHIYQVNQNKIEEIIEFYNSR